jgi:hypothetical protein
MAGYPPRPLTGVPRMWTDRAATVSIRSLPSRPVSARAAMAHSIQPVSLRSMIRSPALAPGSHVWRSRAAHMHRAHSSSLDRQPPGTPSRPGGSLTASSIMTASSSALTSQVLVQGRSGSAGSHRQTHELRDYRFTQLLRAGLTHVEHLPGVRAGELNVTVAVPVERQGDVIGGAQAITTSTARSRPSPQLPHLAQSRAFRLGAMSSRALAGITSEADRGPWRLERGRKEPNR